MRGREARASRSREREREAQQHVVTSQGAEPAFSSSASLLLFSTCLCSIRLVSRGSLGSTLSPFPKNREEREREQMHRGPGRERVEKGESETILRRQWRRVARARLCILFGRACERAVRHCSLCRRLLSDDSGRAQRRRREEEQHARLSACVPACEKGGAIKNCRRVREQTRAIDRSEKEFALFHDAKVFAPRAAPAALLPRRRRSVFIRADRCSRCCCCCCCSTSKQRPREVDALGQAPSRRRRE